jgi:hypothetical protein
MENLKIIYKPPVKVWGTRRWVTRTRVTRTSRGRTRGDEVDKEDKEARGEEEEEEGEGEEEEEEEERRRRRRRSNTYIISERTTCNEYNGLNQPRRQKLQLLPVVGFDGCRFLGKNNNHVHCDDVRVWPTRELEEGRGRRREGRRAKEGKREVEQRRVEQRKEGRKKGGEEKGREEGSGAVKGGAGERRR